MPEHLVADRSGRQVDAHQVVLELLGNDAVDDPTSPRCSSSGTTTGLVKRTRIVDDGAWVADPVGDQPGRGGHGEHAVGDHVGQPDPTAKRAFQWIGLKSPDAPAYRTRSARVIGKLRVGSCSPSSTTS